MPADPEIEALHAKLQQAFASNAPQEQIDAIQQQLRIAYERRDAARKPNPAAEYRFASIDPYTPHYTATPEIQPLLRQLRTALASSDLADHTDVLLARAEPYIALKMSRGSNTSRLPPDQKKEAERNLPLGASRFGFIPDLPRDLPWPTEDGNKIPFLAQLDLSTFPHWPGSPLPSHGWLYAFASFPPKPPWRYAMRYYAGTRDTLIRQSQPWFAEEFWASWNDTPFYDLVTFEPQLAIDINPQLVESTLDSDELEDLRDLMETITPFSNDSYANVGYAGHLLGQSGDFNNETDTDTLNSLIDTGIHPLPLRLSLQPGGPGNDWIHLFSLRSVGSMEWCDAGFIYFLIRRSDLLAQNFQNVVLSLCTS